MFGLLEMIKTGTSHFTDMYYFVEETARAVERSGIRGILGVPILEAGNPYNSDANDALKIAETILRSCRKGLVDYCVAPHSIYLCTEETFTSRGRWPTNIM